MGQILTASSLEKILPNAKKIPVEKKGKMAKNEVYSFQIAFKYDRFIRDFDLTINSKIKEFITVRQVEYVPCTSPNTWQGDGYMIKDEPFLCPDVLKPFDKRGVFGRYNIWNVIWVTVKGNLPVGKHNIELSMGYDEYKLSCNYTLEVLDYELPKIDFTYTNWFHYDSIANYYNLPVFSKKYNEIMYKYIECAVNHGMNMLLVPMFTPPLDTREGSERKTAQLVDICLTENGYDFNFDRLIEFMKNVKKLGIEYFEMSHLFTQWGAKACPKIVAKKNGRRIKIFGWDDSATGEKYTHFLSCFLPKLRERLISEGLYDKCRFHISDEPNEACLQEYKGAKDIFRKYMPDALITDALSHYDFYKDGLVDSAICATDAIQVFLDNNVPNLWAYYCCAQSDKNLSNRFLAFPSLRTRVLGVQLYLNKIKGFLHWGYNFYNSILSDVAINPYFVTDAGGGFQSGDGFVVYPGENGPYDSIRHECFYDGFQDMYLLYALEKKIGRESVEKILFDYGFEKGFYVYPHNEKVFLEMINKIKVMTSEAK
ncbi:MAG: DUF4091 domain-containing protein [Clostridia bacterium]|nr:DUF4091 domain-containing protein [Clostridia bacterium]